MKAPVALCARLMVEDASHASTLNTLVPTTTPLAASAAALYTPQPMSAGGTTDAQVLRLQELENEALQYKTEAQRCRTLSVSLSRQLAHFKLEEADWRAKEADAERRAAVLLTHMVDRSPNLLSVYQPFLAPRSHNGYSANAAPLAAVVPSSAAKRRADHALLMPPPPLPPPTAAVSAAARMAAVAPKIAPALAVCAPVAPVATEAPVITPTVAPAFVASSAFAWSTDDDNDDPAESAAPTTPTAEPVTMQPVPSAKISVAASTTIVAPSKTWRLQAAPADVELDATAAHTATTATKPQWAGERVAHCRPMHALGMATAKARVHSLQLLANELFTADDRGCLRFWELPAGDQRGKCRAILRGPKDMAAARLSQGFVYTATLAGAALRLDLEGRKDMELRCAAPPRALACCHPVVTCSVCSSQPTDALGGG